MSRKAITLVIAVLFLPLVSPLVHAATSQGALPSALEAFIEVIGPEGIGNLYQRFSLAVDSILALFLFISLGVMALKKFNTKAPGVVVGIVLAIAFMVFETNTGFRLAVDLGPLVIGVLFFILLFFMYALFNRVIKNRVAAALTAFLFVWIPLQATPLPGYLQESGFYQWFAIMWLIAVIMLLVYAGRWVFGMGSGSSSGGIFGGAPNATNNSLFSNLGAGAQDSKNLKAQIAKDRQIQAAEAGKRMGQTVRAELDNNLKAVDAADTSDLGLAQQLREYAQKTYDFMQGVHAQIQPDIDAGHSRPDYVQTVGNYQRDLNAYFTQKRSIFKQLAQTKLPEVAQQMEQDEQQWVKAVVNNPATLLYSEIKDYESWLNRVWTKKITKLTETSAVHGLAEGIQYMKSWVEADVRRAREMETHVDRIMILPTRHAASLREIEGKLTDTTWSNVRGAVSAGPAVLREKLIVLLPAIWKGSASIDMNGELSSAKAMLSKFTAESEAVIKRLRDRYPQLSTTGKRYEEIRALLKEHVAITERWASGLPDIGKEIGRYQAAIIRYIGQPTNGNYSAAERSAKDLLKLLDGVIDGIEKQRAAIGKMQQLLQAIKDLEKPDVGSEGQIVEIINQDIYQALVHEEDLSALLIRLALAAEVGMELARTYPVRVGVSPPFDAGVFGDEKTSERRQAKVRKAGATIITLLKERLRIIEQAYPPPITDATVPDEEKKRAQTLWQKVKDTEKEAVDSIKEYERLWNQVLPGTFT